MISTTEPERAPSRAESATLARASGRRGRLRARAMVASFFPPGLLAALTLAFRLPVLINASALNSDMAVVGLQAMHILRGEWSWYLWGTGYQAPFDSLLVALLFAITGPSPSALAVVPVIGQLVFVGFVYSVLKNKFNRWQAALLSLPVVLTPMAVNYTLIMVQRLACTLMFAVSIWLLDGAREAKNPRFRYALGCWCAFISVYFDLYGLQWLPALLVFALLCTLDATTSPRVILPRVGAALAGALSGYATFSLLRSVQSGTSNQVGFASELKNVIANFLLLWSDCLPWALGYRVFYNNGLGAVNEWRAPVWFRDWQIYGAWIVAAGVVFAVVAVWLKRIPWTVRRLGLFGAGVTASTLGAFLVSLMPVDLWATRYIAPMIFVLPFTFAPAFYVLRKTKLASIAIGVYAVSAGVGGWMSYGLDYRDESGALSSTAVGRGDEERLLADFLRARRIRAALAQYWVSYRLTFLFQENPIVVPVNPGQDRYWAYRAEFDRQRDIAYIVHPSAPMFNAIGLTQELQERKAKYEEFHVARYTVFIEHL